MTSVFFSPPSCHMRYIFGGGVYKYVGINKLEMPCNEKIQEGQVGLQASSFKLHLALYRRLVMQ